LCKSIVPDNDSPDCGDNDVVFVVLSVPTVPPPPVAEIVIVFPLADYLTLEPAENMISSSLSWLALKPETVDTVPD